MVIGMARATIPRLASLLRPMQIGSLKPCDMCIRTLSMKSRAVWLQGPSSSASLLMQHKFSAFRMIADMSVRHMTAAAVETQQTSTPAPVSSLPVAFIPNQAQHHEFPRARAIRRRFKTSMKKLNLVCKLVRRARVDAALLQLSLTPKRVARDVRASIYSAKINAINCYGMDPDNLLVDEIRIGRSTYLKRMEYKGRGRSGVRRLPYCYMAVFIREVQPTDKIDKNHLQRRRPRWKCGSVRQ